jgi:hypothetical protein
MGILRGTKPVTRSIEDIDPFDGLDESFLDKSVFSSSSDKASKKLHKSDKNSSASRDVGLASAQVVRPLRKYLAAAVLIALTGFAVARSEIWNYFGSRQLVYAYFEVRAVDANGRPVAGAVVKNAGKRVGTTDSFGEWRRYMRVPLGATVPVTIAKKHAATELLFATKNFAVPLLKPEKSEIELRGSVQLQITDIKNSQASIAAQVAPNDMMRIATKQESAAEDLSKNKEGARGLEKELAGTTMTAVASRSSDKNETSSGTDLSQASVKLQGSDSPHSFVSTHESIWFEVSGSTSSALQRDVIPALAQRARELGLTVDQNSPWKVRLTNLMDKPSKVDKEGGGLILISSMDDNSGGSVREFLRNYQLDARGTAKGILYVLSHHVNKNVALQQVSGRWVATLPKSSSELWKLVPGISLAGAGSAFILSEEIFSAAKDQGFVLRNSTMVPCAKTAQNCELRTRSVAEVPPMPNWSRLRLRALTSGKDPMKIFVSGYEAKLVGDKIYEYWGQDHARANVTVVQNGKIATRTQVLSDAANPPTLGAVTVTKR